MKMRIAEKFEQFLEFMTKATTVLFVVIGLIVIPLMLWSSWTTSLRVVESVHRTLFCLSLGWCIVSVLQVDRGLRKFGGLGPRSSEARAIFSGPRPSDPDRYFVWKWAWHFMASVIVTMVLIALTPFIYK
jgi:hypothetical protein